MVEEAKDAGADMVKFQTFWCFQHLLKYELTKSQWKYLFRFCDNLGIPWFSTAFDREAADFLAGQHMKIWKVPSGMMTNAAFLTYVRDIPKDEVIMSTGMCTNGEIKTALDIVDPAHALRDLRALILLHCTSVYPCPVEEVHLLKMLDMCGFGYPVGYSCHTPLLIVPAAAVAIGAEMVEAHLQGYDKGCPDYKASFSNDKFSRMVMTIRLAEAAMGNDVKEPTNGELAVRDNIRNRNTESFT